jgi:hypothetical protein
MKVLFDKSLLNNRVTCMEVSGMYLLAGYKSGALVVWDVKTA